MRPLVRFAVFSLFVALGLSACYSLSFLDNTVRCSSDPHHPCPPNYYCVGGYCNSSPADLGADGNTLDGSRD